VRRLSLQWEARQSEMHSPQPKANAIHPASQCLPVIVK
jgi:hypothetical protein